MHSEYRNALLSELIEVIGEDKLMRFSGKISDGVSYVVEFFHVCKITF